MGRCESETFGLLIFVTCSHAQNPPGVFACQTRKGESREKTKTHTNCCALEQEEGQENNTNNKQIGAVFFFFLVLLLAMCIHLTLHAVAPTSKAKQSKAKE